MEVVNIVVLSVLVLLAGVAIYLQIRRRPDNGLDVVKEKLNSLEIISRSVQEIQVELRGVKVRVESVEKDQTRATGDLGQSVKKIGGDLNRAINDLTAIQENTRLRLKEEQSTSESIRRLETIIAGTHTKGKAGENIVELMFNDIPLEWQERQFKVANKPVEFAIRLPNNRVLPIDSKWAATDLLDQFSSEDNPEKQNQLKAKICDAVIKRAKEVCKYVDPPATMDYALAVLPDAAYELSSSVHADAYRLRVILVSYSLFMPYLLLVFQTVLTSSKSISVERMNACLHSIHSNLSDLKNEIEGRFSKALKELVNSRDDMNTLLSKASSGLMALEIDGKEENPPVA